MKRFFIILVILVVSNSIFANSKFDKTTNYQFNNVPALVGETLYLVPLTGTKYTTLTLKPVEHYHHFMDYNKFYKNEMVFIEPTHQYKYNPHNPKDCSYAGTHKRWIEGHYFYVNEVSKFPDYNYMWTLHLTDLNTGERVKYVINGEHTDTGICTEYFPFVIVKHLNYLKSLIGTKLVFATQTYKKSFVEDAGLIYDDWFLTDINTGKKINYTTPYVKWTIKDVYYDVENVELCFIVTNGVNTTKVGYSTQYSTHHPTYNIGNRVFPEKQWNMLVNKYGEEHMSLIMQSEISDDMTIEEKYMSQGLRAIKFKETSKTEEIKECCSIIGNTLKKSTTKTFKNVKEAFSIIIKQ